MYSNVHVGEEHGRLVSLGTDWVHTPGHAGQGTPPSSMKRELALSQEAVAPQAFVSEHCHRVTGSHWQWRENKDPPGCSSLTQGPTEDATSLCRACGRGGGMCAHVLVCIE